jgi:hypothetical protein
MIPRRPEAGSLTLTLLSVATEGSGAIFGGSFLGRFELVFRFWSFLVVFGRFWAVLSSFLGRFGPGARRKKARRTSVRRAVPGGRLGVKSEAKGALHLLVICARPHTARRCLNNRRKGGFESRTLNAGLFRGL